jgi:serine protease Do
VQVPVVVDPFDFLFGRRHMAQRTETALGSGVIVSKEGHILTNHHVIANMDEIRVQLMDGRVLPAQLIGSDQAVDIAVLQVNANGLVPLPFGDSDHIHPGEMVFAIGNPFGLQETVTRGIISAKGRALRDSGVEFLQTDAAVNPGNSGGPLLNLRGEIVGINSAIYSQSGAWAGISFAIPANTARATLESLLKTGRPVRGYLGFETMLLTPALARQFGAPDTAGVLITSVAADSPAERAGLQPGDIIRGVNGKTLTDNRMLSNIIAKAGIGSKVQLHVWRSGAEGDLTLQIAELPAKGTAAPDTQ